MRNRDLVFTKIERLEGIMKTLKVMTTRPNTTVEDFHITVNNAESILEDLKSMIEREPMSPNEVNRV
jgi:hypothetical protein